MILNQEQIRRMTNGGSTVAVGGVGSGSGSGDDITMAWVDANYVSKEFFSRLFKAYDSAATPNEVLPNDLESTITNIKLMFGTWTEQYLSALGQSAGGSSGASALVDLTDVAISSPTDGQVLTYDANLGKWVNRAAGGGGSGISMSDVWDAMDGSTSEQINASHLSDALSNYVTSSAISDMATKTWCNNRFITSEAYTGTVTSVRVRAISPVQSSVSTAQTSSLDTTISLADGYGDSKSPYGSKTKNYVLAAPSSANGTPSFRALVASDIPDLSETYLTSAAISDMATKTWVSQQGFLTSSAISDMATQTWVGQQGFMTSVTFNDLPTLYWADVAISNQSNNNTSPQFGNLRLRPGSSNYGSYLRFGDGDYCYLSESSDDHLKIYASKGIELLNDNNYNIKLNDLLHVYKSGIAGSSSNFPDSTPFTSYTFYNVLRSTTHTIDLFVKSTLNIANNSAIRWQNASGSIVTGIRLNNNNQFEIGYGMAGSNYESRIYGGSTAGIKFYCGESTEVASVYKDSSRQGLRIGNALLSWDSDNNALKVQKYDGTAINMYSLGGVSSLGAWTGTNGDITVTGVTATGNVQGANLIATTKVTSPKFYFDSSRFLFLDGTTLKFNNNGTIKTVVLS